MGSKDISDIMILLYNLQKFGRPMFILLYGQEDVMPMEYIIPSLKIVAIMEMTNVVDVEEILLQLA